MKHAILVMASILLPTPALADAITLDTSRSVGPTVSISTPSGINCSETAGDRPSVWLGGRLRDQRNQDQVLTPLNDQGGSQTIINSDLGKDESGWSVGVGLHIPFGGPPTGNCRRFLAIAEREARVNILAQLLTNNAITIAEYRQRMEQLYEESN